MFFFCNSQNRSVGLLPDFLNNVVIVEELSPPPNSPLIFKIGKSSYCCYVPNYFVEPFSTLQLQFCLFFKVFFSKILLLMPKNRSGASPPNPPPGTLSPGPQLGLRFRPRWPPAAGGCRPQTPALYLPITEKCPPPFTVSLDPPLI